jgi:hypothetical protein
VQCAEQESFVRCPDFEVFEDGVNIAAGSYQLQITIGAGRNVGTSTARLTVVD